MIDLHVHLLPGVDDGPRALPESLDLARALVAVGVRRAVLTPHIDDWTAPVLPDVAAVVQRVTALRHELAAASIPLAIMPGGECFLTPELLDRAAAGTVPTWGRSPCLLVEMMERQRVLHADRMIASLLRSGLRVVLAHPERYAFVQEDPNVLDDLLAMGLVLQGTAAAFVSTRTPNGKTVRTLLARGKLQLLASDAHNARGVRLYQEGIAEVRALAGDRAAELLCEHNPAALLLGDRPLLPVVPTAAPRRAFRLPFTRRA